MGDLLNQNTPVDQVVDLTTAKERKTGIIAAQLDEIRGFYPELASEFDRIQSWCMACIGPDVAEINGKEFDS